MASGGRLTLGHPFFPRPASEDSFGLADGVAVADGDPSGVGVGDAFFRFDLPFGVEVGDGVGEAFFRFGEAVGVGSGVVFFFRCLRDGVGDGSKTFLIFVPNDSWADAATSTTPKKITQIRSHFITRRCSVRCPQRRIGFSSSVGCAEDSARYNACSSARNMSDALRTAHPTVLADRHARGPPAHRQDVCATSSRFPEGSPC